jgi:hypothetical protein
MGQQQQADATQQAAEDAFKNDQQQLTMRELQEQEALAQREQAINLEEAEIKATATVGGIEAGVGGISMDNLLADVSRRAARNRVTERTNTRNTITQIQMEKRGSASQAQSRVNSAPRPSALSLVAGLGSNMLSGFNAYDRYKMT